MKKAQVPQDNNRSYGGHKKVIYAVNEAGQYETIGSSGWESEEFVTLMAVDELKQQSQAAYERVQQGLTSPLEYHMYAKRLDVLGLAQTTGYFQWQIRRHMKPSVFRRLSNKQIQRYLEVLDLSVEEFTHLPINAIVIDNCHE